MNKIDLYSLKREYAQTLIVVGLIIVSLFGFSTLLETVFSVVDHLWTQDSTIVDLIVGGKAGHYIGQ